MTFYKNQLVILIALIVLLTTGCSGNTAINEIPSIDEMQENAEADLEKTIEENRLKDEELLERHYGHKYYFEDYGTLPEDVNEYFNVKLSERANGITDSEVYVDANIELFNDSLYALKEGALTIEEIYENKTKYVKDYNVDFFYVLKEDEIWGNGDIVSDYKEAYYDEFTRPMKKMPINEYNFRLAYLKPAVAKEINVENTNFISLNKFILEVYKSDVGTGGIYRVSSDYKAAVEYMSKIFNTEFIFYKFPNSYFATGYYAPKDNPELHAEMDVQNGYMNSGVMHVVQAQDFMNKEVDKILMKHNAESFIGYLNFPESPYQTSILSEGYDMTNIESIDFLNNVFSGDYEQSLYYILEEDEEIDKELITDIIYDIQTIVKDTDENNLRQHVFVYFYRMNKNSKKLTIDLFRKNALCSRELQVNDGGLGNIYSNMHVTRVDNEAFFYLDNMGKAEEFILSTTTDADEIMKIPASELFEIIKYKSEFER